jgi:hypothetical protein
VLETLAIVFFITWLLGVSSTYTLGGLIHIFLVLAIVLILLRVSQGQSRS